MVPLPEVSCGDGEALFDRVGDDRFDVLGLDVANQLTVHHHARTGRAITETEHFLYLHRFSLGEMLCTFPYGSATTGLTSLCPTNLHDWATGLLSAEVLVEGDDAVHLGDGDVEHLCEQWSEFWIDPSSRVLHRVQRRQEPAFDVLETAHDGVQFGTGGHRAQGVQA